jgi:hypothetical protein
MNRAELLSYKPYEQYTGQRFAGFDPLTIHAFERMEDQTIAPQLAQAGQMAQQAGLQGLAGGSYQPGEFSAQQVGTRSITDPNNINAYMSPYMQNVVDAQLREAQRAADIATTTRAGAATKAGAFGGSRQAIMDAEAQRNLALQKGDIQATGLQAAFQNAQQQFNTEDALRLQAQTANQRAGLEAAQLGEQSRQFGADLGYKGIGQSLQAAQILGQLGGQQFDQEMAITQGMGYAGMLRSQQQQQELDTMYQDYLAQQKYPYEQLTFLYPFVTGTPSSTTTSTSGKTSGVTTPGTQTSSTTAHQYEMGKPPGSNITSNAVNVSEATGIPAGDNMSMLAEGGVVGYAEGGITGLLSDRQLQQRQQNPNLPTIARLAAEVEAKERAGIRQGAQPRAPQGARPTVADEVMAGLGALEDDVPDDVVGYAGGGILSGLMDFFTSDEEDVPKLMAARERYQAAGADTTAIDQAIKTAATRQSTAAAENRGLLNAADADLRSQVAPNQTAAETARLARQEAGLAAIAETAPAGPIPAASAAPKVAPVAKGGLGDTPEAATAPGAMPTGAAPGTVPAPASAQPAAPQGIDAVLQNYRSVMGKSAQEQADLAKAEADAIAKLEADRLARFDLLQKTAGKGDEEARGRIAERKDELEAQRKQALTFAIVRAALAMMSGESKYALVNIGRGAQAGLNQFAADTQKIDEAKEGLRKELDRLDQIRREAQTASAEKREQLMLEYDKAKINATFAGRKVLVASGVEADKAIITAVTEAAIKQHFSLQDKAVEHQYRIGEIQEQGRQSRASSTAAAKLSPVVKEQIDGVDAQIRATNDQLKTLMGSRRPRTQETIAALNRQLQALQAQRNQLLGVQSAAPAGGSRIKFDAQGNPI